MKVFNTTTYLRHLRSKTDIAKIYVQFQVNTIKKYEKRDDKDNSVAQLQTNGVICENGRV